jgi:hypothetical protein
MSIMLPNWFLLLGSIGIVIWIFVGIQAVKAFRAMRERAEAMPMIPPRPRSPSDDADWWKRDV